MMDVMIGIDPHKRSHTAAMLDGRQRELGQITVRAGGRQLAELLAWADGVPGRTWAVECASGLGYLLAQQLVAAGETVLDVPATLASRVRLLGTGQSSKTDPNDARSVAVAALHAPALAVVRRADHVTVCRLLAKRHTDVARWRTKQCCRLHALVAELVPGGIGKEVVVNQARSLLDEIKPQDAASMERYRQAVELVAEIERLDVALADSRARTNAAVAASGPNTQTADWDSFRKWYPGIKQGRFQVSNSSGEPITVTLHTGSDSASGCWYAPSWADAPAFPAAGITVPAGQTSARYVMGAYTAGPDGTCSATNNTDIWRGYLVITPVNQPADARLVRLRLNANMFVDVSNQAGGATTVSISRDPQQSAAFGLWTISVGTAAAPVPLSPPTVTAARITPTGLSGPAVYRFDVTGGTFQLGDTYANQMTVPPLIVQGSINGTTWTDVGTLVPATAPTIVPQGNQFHLQVGPATFWWENTAGQPAYQQLRVMLGPAGPASAVVTLSNLPAPAAPTNVSGPQIAATSGSNGIAAPVDTGIDQAPLSVQVNDTNSQPLPISDPSYQRIYYRDFNTHVLITNLFGTDPSTFIGVSPYAGAYPNNGSAGSGPPGTFDGFHYLATTSTIDRNIIGYVAINTSQPGFSTPIEVRAAAIAPVNNTTSAANGIALAGCQDFANSTCRLAQITTSSAGEVIPAMYLDTTNGVRIGLLTVAQATTAVSTLPLQHPNGTAEHLLASVPLSLAPTAATLTDTAPYQQGDRVDTNLVTHGILVPIADVPVN